VTILTKDGIDIASIPQVEVAFMNKTHQEEVALVNKLSEQISDYQQQAEMSPADIAVINATLEQWFTHTKAHFDQENKFMKLTGFPAYAIHFDEHDSALKRMIVVITNWKRNHDLDLLADYVFSAWPDWFDAHVNSMDMMTAKFAVMTGFDPNSLPNE